MRVSIAPALRRTTTAFNAAVGVVAWLATALLRGHRVDGSQLTRARSVEREVRDRAQDGVPERFPLGAFVRASVSALARDARAVAFRAFCWCLSWRRARWLLLALTPLLALNLSVAFFGRCWVFPLSVSFLGPKVKALAHYAVHRPRCLGLPHPELGPIAAFMERRHHLPRGLLAAVVEVESGGRVHRISRAGAMGPAQLSPATARILRVADPFDPEESLDGAARYLAQQWRAFRDIRLTAAAYNAGPGAIVHRQIPHNGETELYVEKVTRALARLAPPPPPRKGPILVAKEGPSAGALPTKTSPSGARPLGDPPPGATTPSSKPASGPASAPRSKTRPRPRPSAVSARAK